MTTRNISPVTGGNFVRGGAGFFGGGCSVGAQTHREAHHPGHRAGVEGGRSTCSRDAYFRVGV